MSLKTNKDALITIANRGGITLVLGAGVSLSAGFPNWEDLAKRMWDHAFPDKKSPWDAPLEKSPRSLPQFLPIIFEMVMEQLKGEKFVEALHHYLYPRYPRPTKRRTRSSKSSLEVIARLISQEHKYAGRRRIIRVVTFNVDDLLERKVHVYAKKQACEGFARADRRIRWERGDEPIPIYHLHGFIPQARGSRQAFWAKNYDHMLVFTDSQYWDSSSKMPSFANRIMGYALNDSHCIFIGLSMVDINLLRWLALRRNELITELDEIYLRYPKHPLTGKDRLQDRESRRPFTLRQHFWIRPKSDDPSGLLTKFLETRGVRSVGIRSWNGTSFEKLITQCLPPDH